MGWVDPIYHRAVGWGGRDPIDHRAVGWVGRNPIATHIMLTVEVRRGFAAWLQAAVGTEQDLVVVG